MEAKNNLRPDFETAMGEEFGDLVCPPVPTLDASPHECCQAVWLALGRDVTPSSLANLSELQFRRLAKAFSNYFECAPPSVAQLAEAVARTLSRWPPGSLGE
jgi:hypothetical protein